MVGPVVRRILVVEDQAISRDLITMVLRKLRYDVDAVGNAHAALSCLGCQSYALVLLDRSLPDMDGREVLRRVRATPGATADVPVVLLGDDDAHDHVGPESSAIQGRLAKPIQIDRLLGLVRSLTTNSGDHRLDRDGGRRPPAVDIDHLLSFTDGDGQLERELVALFLSTARVYIDRMARAIDDDDEWSAAAHALRGASVNLGARELAAIAERAERAAPDDATLELLHAAVEDVRGFFERRGGVGFEVGR